MGNPFDLSGRRFLITGASSGIGRETARVVDELGGDAVLVGRDRARLDATRMSLRGPGHFVAPFDLTDCDSIPAWLKGLASEGGPFDCLVHAAGVQTTIGLRGTTAAAIEAIMRTNVYSAAMLARGMVQKGCCTAGASIVLLSSVMAFASRPGVSLYSASKAALVGLCKSLALELAPRIRVNCVSPAFVETEMTENLRAAMLPEDFESIRLAHPLGLGTPRDVAYAAIFLGCTAGKWITGTNLVVDGGYSAR